MLERAALRISADFLAFILKEGMPAFRPLKNVLPPDARIVDCVICEPGMIDLVFEAERFPCSVGFDRESELHALPSISLTIVKAVTSRNASWPRVEQGQR